MKWLRVRLVIQSILYCAAVIAYGIVQWPLAQPSQVAAAPGVALEAAPPVTSLSTPVPVQVPIKNMLTDPKKKIAVKPKGPTRGNILMYHYVRSGVDPAIDPLGYRLSVTPQLLDAQLTAMQNAGYREISMEQYRAGEGSSRTVTLTFDDGYEDFYSAAYPILTQHGWHATAYIVSGFIGKKGYMTGPQVQEIARAGMEIGVHTVDHNDLAHQSPDAQHHEIFDSKAAIERLIGKPTVAFCYPAGRYNDSAIASVTEAGFTSATTTEPGAATTDSTKWYLLPRIRIGPSQSPQILLHNLY